MPLQLFRKVHSYENFRASIKEPMGIVPTMGNLHQGHLNLVLEALKNMDHVTVTIFVNPKQFGPNEDFDKYPRTLEDDCGKLKEILKDFPNKSLYVLSPESVDEIYPQSFNKEIIVEGLDGVLCDEFRPGHFHGVTTVVNRLFEIIWPQKAWFGQKDFQQFKILEKMVKDLGLPIEMNSVAIAREQDGLALSSRNQYLSIEERREALKLSQSIKQIEEMIISSGLSKGLELKSQIKAQDSRFQYLEVLDATNLKDPNQQTAQLVIAGAMFLGETRLIDNTLLSLNHA